MKKTQAFISWFLCRFAGDEPRRCERLVEDGETARLGLRPRTVEMAIAGGDAAWRLYRLALTCGFADVAASYYEVYELVCRSLTFAVEGTW